MVAHLTDLRCFLRVVADILEHFTYNRSEWGQGRGSKRHAREFGPPLAVHVGYVGRKCGKCADLWT